MKPLIDYKLYLKQRTSLADSSLQKYVNVVRQFLNKVYLEKKHYTFTLENINDFIYDKTKGNKQYNTVKFALRYLCLQHGKDEWVTKLRPVKKQQRVKHFPYFKRKVMNKIITMLKPPYNYLAFLQATMGLRRREAATLKVENFNFDADPDIIFVYIQEFTKGQKRRTIYIEKKHEQTLRKIIGNKEQGFIIIRSKDYADRDKVIAAVNTLVQRYNEKLAYVGKVLGINGLSSHYIRHHFADYYIKMGGDISALQSILGHESIDTTRQYISIGEESTRANFKKVFLQQSEIDMDA